MSEIIEKDSSLEEVDDLLNQEDPQFHSELQSVAQVKVEGEIDPDSAIDELSDNFDEDDPTDSAVQIEEKPELKTRVREFLVVLKTRPKEFLGFFLAQIKGHLKSVKALSRAQKFVVLLVLVLSLGVILLTSKNLKGVWIPKIDTPVIYSLAQVADAQYDLGAKPVMKNFLKAFPKSPDLFLFDKFKVNLRPSADHPNPMGAFEVVLELDSKDSAVEVQGRQVELHDLIQRDFETQPYPSMVTEEGKNVLKELIKRDIDQKLEQGWVEDVHFQTFILKP